MRVRKLSICLAMFFLIFTVTRTAFGQGANQGSIQGTITDQSGAAVPGVGLKATNTQTGIGFTTTSNADGLYTFLVVPWEPIRLLPKSPGWPP